MEHLAQRGIVCPLPVHGRDGVALRHLCGRHAAITTFLPGVWPRRVRPEHCGPVGAALAALHVAGRDYAPTRRNALGPDGWRPLLERSRARADEVQAGLASELEGALAGSWRHGRVGLPVGHIHADLFPDNVFFLDGRLSGLIDFYFAATDILAYDVAVCLNAWCFEADFSFNVTKARALLRAYDATRALSDAERAALPVLCRGAAIRFLLTRLYDWLNTPAGRTGDTQGSAGIPAAPALPSGGTGRARLWHLSRSRSRRARRRPRWWRSGPTAAASQTRDRAAGRRFCASAALSANCPAPIPRPPTTAWSSPRRRRRWRR